MMQASSDAASLQPLPDNGATRRQDDGLSSPPPPGTSDAVYVKSPLTKGVMEYPERSVVVLGDVPAGEQCKERTL